MQSRIENDKNIYNDKRCEDQEGRCVGEIDYIEREGYLIEGWTEEAICFLHQPELIIKLSPLTIIGP